MVNGWNQVSNIVKQNKMGLKNFFDVGPVLGYFFRKKDPNQPTNRSIKAMHGVNKISILMFIVALFVMLYRLIFR